jgi:hypothetical protein
MATPDTLPPSGSTDTAARHRETARRALEEVCSGRDLAAVEEVYSPLFVDHVNALEYHGTEGARRSVSLYLKLFLTCASRSQNRSSSATGSHPAGCCTGPIVDGEYSYAAS